MKRIETIKDKKIFNNMIKKGKFIKNNHYVIYIMKREDEKINFGIAISNKIGNAVTRNKLKRQTRSIIDNNRTLFKNGYNYIIMIRKTLLDATFETMNKSFNSLLENRRGHEKEN